MEKTREIEKKLKQGIDVDLGKHTFPIKVNPDVQSDLVIEKKKIEKEKHMPDSLDYNQFFMILLGRAKSWRQNKENPNVRGQIVNETT